MKPIHKFNNGNGATLCHRCRKIISVGFTDDLYCSDKCKKKHTNETMKTYEIFTNGYSKIVQAITIGIALKEFQSTHHSEALAITLADRPDLLKKIEPSKSAEEWFNRPENMQPGLADKFVHEAIPFDTWEDFIKYLAPYMEQYAQSKTQKP